ncbi:MAG: Hsp33 family molecular chaperone HslO [Oscillospiraceae bacterium]|nr:Hsp33 family molecular chaperone HslO [Oscillospiraceae bacterium]
MDHIVRCLAGGGLIRGFAASTRLTVEDARRRHNTAPAVTAALGRLLTAASMMGSMMKSEGDVITLRITGDGPVGHITAISDHLGRVRGYAAEPLADAPPREDRKLPVKEIIGNGTISVTRELALSTPFTGTCELMTGEVAEDLAYYFTMSEQTPSAVGLGVLMNKNNTVKRAGGFIIQLMPGANEDTVALLDERISSISSVTAMLDEGLGPKEILERIFEGLDCEFYEPTPIQFYCPCSREKLLNIIRGLDRAEINTWIEEGRPIEAVCDYCGTSYEFECEELK